MTKYTGASITDRYTHAQLFKRHVIFNLFLEVFLESKIIFKNNQNMTKEYIRKQ